MPEFHVIWRIELSADDATAAAEKAREIQLDQASLATCFEVQEHPEDKPVVVDLGAQPKMFSVLLLYPDHTTDNYGTDTFYEAVEANTSGEAVLALQERLGKEHDADPADFACLLCLEGRHFDINPTF